MFKDLGKVFKHSFHDCSTDTSLLSIVKQSNASSFTGIKHYWWFSVYIPSTTERHSISKFLVFLVWDLYLGVS